MDPAERLQRLEELLTAGRVQDALDLVHVERRALADGASKQRRAGARASLVGAVTQALGEAGLQPTAVLEALGRHLAEGLDAGCVVTLASSKRERLEIVAAHHPHQAVRELMERVLADTPITANDMAAPWNVLIPGTSPLSAMPCVHTEMLGPPLSQAGVSCLLVVPLRTRERTLGAVAMSRDRGASPFDAEDRDAIQTLADRAALAYENARLHGELATQRALLERVLRQIPHGIIVVEAPSGRSLFANAAAEEVLGHPHGAVDARTGFAHPDGRPYEPAEYPLARVLATGDPVSAQLRHRRGDGQVRTLQVDAGPVRGPGGGMVAAVVSFFDITDLREENRRKDEFLAMLAHELRNPLAPIRIALGVLRSGTEDVGTMFDVIERQVKHLTRLVDDLLDVSRITRGKIRLELGPTDAVVIARRAIETVGTIIEGRRQRLVVRLPDAPMSLLGDETRLAQVVGNLLHNASKFSPDAARIELSVACEGDDVVFRVVDEGVGIPPESLERVFEPFVQVDTSMARGTSGLGIGLTLVRRLVNLHGGRVRALSDGPGRGAEFIVRLPRRADAAVLPAPALAAARVAPQRRRVLLVDDNEDVALTFGALLGTWGHEVRIVKDGEAALAVIVEARPDVVFLDIGLPGMDGFEVARRMRAGGLTGRIVAVTGYGREEDRRKAQAAGCDALIVKPPDIGAVRQVLDDIGAD